MIFLNGRCINDCTNVYSFVNQKNENGVEKTVDKKFGIVVVIRLGMFFCKPIMSLDSGTERFEDIALRIQKILINLVRIGLY